MEWAREDSIMAVSSHKLCSSNPMKLLPCGRLVVVVYDNGEVQCLGQGTCSLVPKRVKKWMLVMAEVSCDKNICVVGVERTVTIGIAESAGGKLKPAVTISMQPNRIDLVSSCVCKDKLLLLCKQNFGVSYNDISCVSPDRRADDGLVGASLAPCHVCPHTAFPIHCSFAGCVSSVFCCAISESEFSASVGHSVLYLPGRGRDGC